MHKALKTVARKEEKKMDSLNNGLHEWNNTDWYVGWGLWHINHYRLLNFKSCIYIRIKYILFINTFFDYSFKRAHAHLFAPS